MFPIELTLWDHNFFYCWGEKVGNSWRLNLFCLPILIWGLGKQQYLGRKNRELLEMLTNQWLLKIMRHRFKLHHSNFIEGSNYFYI